MADVYRYDENILGCFINGVFYYGFENGAESQVIKETVVLCDQQLVPGDVITGFDSGNKRTSYHLKYGYMTYVGRYKEGILFDVYDPKQKAQQGNLFQQRPKWFLSFALVGNNEGLLMFSQPGACWDIRPYKIIKYEEKKAV